MFTSLPRSGAVASFGALLLAAVALAPAVSAVGVAGATGAGPRPAALAQSGPCDEVDSTSRLDALSREYDYAAGLANDTARDWTGGTVLRIGATGECSLAVTNGSATLTPTRVDGRRGVLRVTVDVGEDGAVRAVANGTNASVAVENVGRENGVAVAVVARRANGSVTRTRLTAPSGRFVDLTMRWTPDGTVRVALRKADSEGPPDAYDATVATGVTNATWTVELRSRAYLDDVAVGTYQPPTPTPTLTPTETESDLFESPPGGSDGADADPDTEAGNANGLVLGPVIALIGAGIYRFAYGIAKFDEQTDAIGSTTPSSEVEPAGWNVFLTKALGALVALAGVGWLLSAVVSVL
ncbi:MAG: hypothetical protein ABEJ05_10130 [Haloglomus sp.]